MEISFDALAALDRPDALFTQHVVEWVFFLGNSAQQRSVGYILLRRHSKA